MVLATLWTSSRDAQKLETCSGQLRRTIIPQPWDCSLDYYEVLGLLRKWRDPNTKRTTALALPWLDDEELHQLYAVEITAWRDQDNSRWLEEGTSPIELYVNITPTRIACTDAHSVSQHILNRMITFHHANTRGSRLHIFVSQNICHVRVMSRSLPHLTQTTGTSSLSPTSPIFPTISPTHTRSLAHDPYLPCDVPRQSGGSTQIPSRTGYEPKVIEPEDFETRRIELDRNLGTDPYQIQERFVRNNYQNPIAEDVDEFGKVGVEMSYIQSQMHSEQDSAESIADSDLEDEELRKMLASTPCIQENMNLLEDQQLQGKRKQ